MKKIIVVSAAVIIGSILGRPTGAVAQDLSKFKVRDKVPSIAVPFNLQDVRLLDGPFHEAMLRDQKYLLEPRRGPAAAHVPRDGRAALVRPTLRRLGGPESASCAATASATI